MSAHVLGAQDPHAISEALAVLRRGGLVAFPTDTVYGLGALASEVAGVERLFAVKGRDAAKAIPVLLADSSGLDEVAARVPEDAERLVDAFWPGALTLVLYKRAEVPDSIGPRGTIGVRVPNHPVALAVLRAAGPLAVTSANRSGADDSLTAEDVVAGLGDGVDLVLDGGRTPGGRPSTVIDCTVSPPRLLREGPITMPQILAVLGPLKR